MMMPATVTQDLNTLPNLDGCFPRIHRFSVQEYHRLIKSGFLTTNDRVELLKGWLVEKMSHNPAHGESITLTTQRFVPLLASQWLLRVQLPITLRDSEPEPDFALVRGPTSLYRNRHPGPRDLGLLIEVAESTLQFDREFKGFLYAQARIAEYWIFNLVDMQIEVYTQPRGGKMPVYRLRRDFSIGKSVLLVLEGREIAFIPVRDLLPS